MALIPISQGQILSSNLASANGIYSMGKGSSYWAQYFGFTIPFGGANSVYINMVNVSGNGYFYMWLRDGYASNTVGGVSGFGADPARVYETYGTGYGSYSRIANGVSSNSPSFNGNLAAGDYTVECTGYFAYNGHGTNNFTLELTYMSNLSTERGSTIRRGSGNNFNTPIGTNNQLITADKGYSYSALYYPRESGGYSRNIYIPTQIGGGGGGGPSLINYYKMRGYYVAGSTYETYVVTGSPSTTPPSGHTLIDVAIVSEWQEEV